MRRYYAALRRLCACPYRSLDPAIRPWFSLVETVYVGGRATVIDRELANAEVFFARPSSPPRRDASRNKAAVAAAYDLLGWWGQKAVVTRGGKWARLAGILIGDPTVDLFDHLRDFKHRSDPGIEKVRGAAEPLKSARESNSGERLLTPRDAADFLRVSDSWLAKARMRGDGPPYVKIGRSIRYQERALIGWTRSRLRLSTSEH